MNRAKLCPFTNKGFSGTLSFCCNRYAAHSPSGSKDSASNIAIQINHHSVTASVAMWQDRFPSQFTQAFHSEKYWNSQRCYVSLAMHEVTFSFHVQI